MFYILLLVLDNIKKEQVKQIPKLDIGNTKKYKKKTIGESAIYVKELKSYLLDLYYLIICKDYPNEKNYYKPLSIV